MTLTEFLQTREPPLSQNKFAKESGIPQTVISKIVRFEREGEVRRGLQTTTVLRVVEATGGAVTIEDLVGGIGSGADI